MLNKKIDSYLKNNPYPFHMPGHKRSHILRSDLPYGRDFTEIDGFDNLNDPNDIFVKMEKDLANIYKVKDAIISTNGSTCGILSAIRSLCKDNKNILIQRSSHKAVYNSALINRLNIDYIDIKTNDLGAIVDIDYDDLENKIKNKSYGALVVTSPSYEGYKLDLEKIYNLGQKYKTKVFVDMAHGSHLVLDGYYKDFFDIAVTSFHKNLSALTPSAALLVNDRSLVNDLRFNMAIFQTSSPSYVILQSIDEMIENFVKFSDLYRNLEKNLDDLYALNLKNLKLIDNPRKDRSKILISTKNTNINGNDLLNLLKKENIEIEMAYPSYALLIASIYDSKDGFDRLKKSLTKIDESLKPAQNIINFSYAIPEKKYQIYEALEKGRHLYDLDKSLGKISADFIYAYPPGIPLISPGEIIDQDILDNINRLKANGISINKDKISCLIDKNHKNW